MPALQLFGQRTFFAGDDICTFLVLHALFRAFQIAVALSLIGITVFYNHNQEIILLENGMNCTVEGSTEDRMTYIYSSVSIVVAGMSIYLVVPMFHYSRKGTPTEPTLREPLRRLCYFDTTVMNVLRIIVFVLGSRDIKGVMAYCRCISNDISVDTFVEVHESCPRHAGFMTAVITLFCTHIFDACMTILTFLYFTFCHENLFINSQIEFVSSEQRCSICLRCCIGWASIFTCCLFGGDKAVRGDYANFSMLLANYVNGKGILDVTASDISVGLHMLRKVRKRNRLETTNRLVREHSEISKQKVVSSRHGSSDRLSLNDDKNYENKIVVKMSTDGNSVDLVHDNCNSEDTKEEIYDNRARPQNLPEHRQKLEILSSVYTRDVNLINEAAHFMIYAQAAYTVVSYMMENPVTGFVSLQLQMLRNWCVCHFPSRKESIVGDNFWQIQTIAFKALSGLAVKDIVYANFCDTITEIPYIILLDHEWKSVVVTIRGTITLESVLTDMNVAPEALTRLGEECGFDGDGLYCHTGMLASTEWLYRDMKRHGKLNKILAEYEGYKLRIVGHSLGAGIAAILSVLLRPKYPDLRCLAFSPPGCVMSENLADDISTFTTAFVVNDDIVARTSIEGFEELRNSILEMICRIKIPKHMVTKVSKNYDDTTVDGLSEAIDHILYDKDDINDSKFKQEIDEFQKHQIELKEKNKESYIKLCPPGNIIQLFLTADVRQSECITTHNGEEIGQYTARWANRSDFEKINISSHLISDHNTNGVKYKLHELAVGKFGLHPPFKPISDPDREM